MKTRVLKRGRTCAGSRPGLGLGWAFRSLLCGVVLGGVLADGSSWAQLPESATIDLSTLEEEVLREEGLPEAALKEAPALKEASAQKTKLTVDALKQFSADAQSLIENVAETVVAVEGGSGVIVSEDGWVMTASHVCGRPGRQIQVRLANGLTWPARTYGVDRQKDTGMLKLLGDHVWPFAQVKQQLSVEPGDWCVVMGYPWDTESLKTPAVRLGRVTAVSEDRIVTDVPIIGGDSGGPVFSVNGELLAINSRIRLNVNQNIHVPVATFVKQIDALRRAEFVRANGVRKQQGIDEALPKEFGRNAAKVRSVVADLVAKAEASVVRLVSVKRDQKQDEVGREVLGTVVTESGLVVAKHSELRSPVKARVDGDWMEAEIVAFNRATDLSLLQLKPEADRTFVSLPIGGNATEENLVGRLILSLVKNPKEVTLTASLGTVMMEPQSFKATFARQDIDLGVVLDAEVKRSGKKGVGISRVYPESLAVQLGLRNGDRLVSINGSDVVDEASLNQVLATLTGGQQVRFSFRRQGELLAFRVVLPAKLPVVWDRWGGGPFSGRRFGFGTVIAHDGVVAPSDCGGPVIDLNGKFVGMNVSRAMRTTTFVVPAAAVETLVQRYQQGQ